MKMNLFQRRVAFGPDPLANDEFLYERYRPILLFGHRVTRPLNDDVMSKRKSHNNFVFEERKRLVVIIPFRGRDDHLNELLPILSKRLIKQNLDYRIAVIEQHKSGPFNPGKIRNVGAKIMAEEADYFCFHDVDNIPEIADYRCPSQPFRLVSNWSSSGRDVDFFDIYACFGGVVSFLKEQFFHVNGYPNNYAGWGWEDNLLFLRVLLAGYAPFEDSQGEFLDLPNPVTETEYRSEKIKKRNDKRYVRDLRLNRVSSSGLSNLTYKLLDFEDLGSKVTKYTVII
jgi:hypothetical protein